MKETKPLKKIHPRKIRELADLARFGMLASGIFHDLMNPLNAVIASVDQLSTDPSHLPETKEHLAKAVAASRRLGEYLSNIRRHMRPSEGQRTFSPKTEISEAFAILGYKARTARVSLEFSDLSKRNLFGNPLRFHQVVLNLVSNAIDSYDGPDIFKIPLRSVQVTLSEAGTFFLLEVVDHGQGMSPEILLKIFEPFFTTKKNSRGVGIGLFSTKEIVEREFNGTISARSTPGQGSVFSVLIPFR